MGKFSYHPNMTEMLTSKQLNKQANMDTIMLTLIKAVPMVLDMLCMTVTC